MTVPQRCRLVVKKHGNGECTLVLEREGESGASLSRVYPSASFLLNGLRDAGALSEKALDQVGLDMEKNGDAESAAVSLTNDQVKALVGGA